MQKRLMSRRVLVVLGGVLLLTGGVLGEARADTDYTGSREEQPCPATPQEAAQDEDAAAQCNYAPCPATADQAVGNPSAQAQCQYDAEGNLVDPNQQYLVDPNQQYWDNDVTCAEPQAEEGEVPDIEGQAATVYLRGEVANGDGQDETGTIEVCADGSENVPVLQGRIIVSGSAEDGGYVAADGDRDNADDAQGWVRADVGGEAGTGIRCGSDEGNLDSTHPNAGDTQAECGPPSEGS